LNVFNDEKIYCYMSNEYKQFKKLLKLLWALYDQRKSFLLWLRILIDKCIEFELNFIFNEFCLFSNNNEILMFFYIHLSMIRFRTESNNSIADFKIESNQIKCQRIKFLIFRFDSISIDSKLIEIELSQQSQKRFQLFFFYIMYFRLWRIDIQVMSSL
jgi:hypothetical protein